MTFIYFIDTSELTIANKWEAMAAADVIADSSTTWILTEQNETDHGKDFTELSKSYTMYKIGNSCRFLMCLILEFIFSNLK